MAKFDSVCVRGRSRFKHDDIVKRRKQNFKRGAVLLIKSRYECAGVDNGFPKLFFAHFVRRVFISFILLFVRDVHLAIVG